MIRFGIVVHGGVGSSPDLSDLCRAASEEALAMLAGGERALDAVVAARRHSDVHA